MSRTVPGLEIVEVDPFDPRSFDPWHAAYIEAELACGPDVASPWQAPEVRAMMQRPGSRHLVPGWAGLVDGAVVTTGWMRLPLLDNLDRAQLAVHTRPAARRQGYGSAMLTHLEQVARDQGRSILTGEAAWPYDAGPTGNGTAGPAFAAVHGFALALGDVKRVLDLPVAPELLDALAAEAAPHHADFTLRSWAGPVPDELVEGWARLDAALITEAPTGDLTVEAEHADPALVREAEALLVEQGRTKYNTAAVGPDGDVVAYTDLVVTTHEPGRGYQFGTLVRRDARGHRLGIAIKVANLRLLQQQSPQTTALTTYNAEVNAHMIGVNERLGFRTVARLGEFQRLV
jgi:GNAT superfamily N-acetyltransferase